MAKHTSGHKKKRILIWILCIVAAFFVIGMPLITSAIYADNFGSRTQMPSYEELHVDDFDGLQVREITFPTSNDVKLVGYQYWKGNGAKHGVMLLAHGLGDNGQNGYMDLIDAFASGGYAVFAYDATACARSDGDKIGGLPQGIVDLDYALRYVKHAPEYSGLPIVLCGHSWGAYSAGAVLNRHPDIKAAVLLAGFNSSLEMMRYVGESTAGGAIDLFVPYFSLYERATFGEYADWTVLDGFANSNAGILIVQSTSDTTVPPSIGYDEFYAQYAEDPRFAFISYSDRDHNDIFASDAVRAYRKDLEERFEQYVEEHDEISRAECRQVFYAQNLNRAQYYGVDPVLMEQILAFCDEWCGR